MSTPEPTSEQIADAAEIFGEHLISSILDYEPLEGIKQIIENGAPVFYQNMTEGISALHAAAFVQDLEMVQFLIEKGAVWNAVDYWNHTAGDIALSFNNEPIYNAIRDTGIRTELLVAALSDAGSNMQITVSDETAAASTEEFLASKLRFATDDSGQDICLLTVDGEEIGVMMGWERPIMVETVKGLCADHPNADSLKILNVGFGLGIIDSLFQALPVPPAHHYIIEAHPDVLRHMRQTGWYDKKGVTILEGKWQDFVESDTLLSVRGFDIIYTDTFSEKYADLRQFFEAIPDLMSGPDSVFSFFNGLGATNALFYDVYTNISELHLKNIGFAVQWQDVDVTANQEARYGQTRNYFSMPLYRLPLVKMNTTAATAH